MSVPRRQGMTLYEQIAANRRRSFLLVTGITGFTLAVGYVFGRAIVGTAAGGWMGLGAALVLALVSGTVSYFAGGKIVLGVSEARRITHADHPQLCNVVEEMAIAAGLPVPQIYLIDDSAPNAFATGRDPAHAAVAITTGLLDKLSRDELQGVMAHEMSHIRNHDILFATMVGVLVGTVALMCDFLRHHVRWGRVGGRRRDSGPVQLLFVVLAVLLAILAPLVARLMQLAVSRSRELMADSSAAELTRYPEGLASALEKIAKDREVLEVANRATQHLYIVNPIKPFEKRAKSLFSTHPPIWTRVTRLRAMGGGPSPAR